MINILNNLLISFIRNLSTFDFIWFSIDPPTRSPSPEVPGSGPGLGMSIDSGFKSTLSSRFCFNELLPANIDLEQKPES